MNWKVKTKGIAFLSGLFLFFIFQIIFSPHPAVSADWSFVTHRLISDRCDEQLVRSLFSRPEIKFEPHYMVSKIQYFRKKLSIKTPPHFTFRRDIVHKSFLKPYVIEKACSFILENKATLDQIEATYGVPQEIIVSIFLVETRLGSYTGHRRAFNTLASMAMCSDFEVVRPHLSEETVTPDNEQLLRKYCHEKADWAYNELKALIHYAVKGNLDPLDIRGSYYGAIGLCQFMPSNAIIYGVDAGNKGYPDLFAVPDALCSIANYLREHGGREGTNKDRWYKAVFAYNHSYIYVNTVLAVAEILQKKNLLKGSEII
jgi:membrane-bound lytic murein transglycosylase B